MYDEKDLTAYCGLFCGDCIPSNAQLFELLGELRELAAELHLDSYAELIARRDAAFEGYPAFERMLSVLAGLRCASPCRAGGGKPSCPIRACAQGKGFEGCWECLARAECGLLQPLREFHGDTIDGNLDAITSCGPEDWASRRGKHYPWSHKGST